MDEDEVTNAFLKYVHDDTSWHIVRSLNRSFVGKTAERYAVFKARYEAGSWKYNELCK